MAEQIVLHKDRPVDVTTSIDWLLDDRPTWVAPLVNRIQGRFANDKTELCVDGLVQFIDHDPEFRKVWYEHSRTLRIKRYNLIPLPAETDRIDYGQPNIRDTPNLAKWLGLSVGRLENYGLHWRRSNYEANRRSHHYFYHWRKQKPGKRRLIEAPKSRLAGVQRQIHLGILNRVPLHDCCCGFRRGFSRIDYARPHTDKKVVIKMDLSNFFTSISLARIYSLFVFLGYSDSVSNRLAGICCNQTPHSVIRSNPELSWRQRRQLVQPHLPQGSPSSPTLANLCAFRMDIRLKGLADKFGADYSRYADDLAFSGGFDLSRKVESLVTWVSYIVANEGFSINHRKTRIMRQGARQRLTGITINRFANYPRKKYDQLKATLHNCVKYGPESQNTTGHPLFQAHLSGRIAEVRSLNPNRSIKLDKLYRQIQW